MKESSLKKMIYVTSPDEGGVAAHKVYAYNGVYIGDFLMKEDGFYDFWPIFKGGYWPAYMLHAIADTLDEWNSPYEKEIEEYFSKQEAKDVQNT